MKRFLLNVAALLCLGLLPAVAQSQLPAHELPLDPAVRIGTLPNGLTYLIRYNKLPEKKADFYIAQKVGSVLEEENQRGLAHFLEHMCFNGTEHFPGDGLKQYLERIGVKFGADLNAYTSIDETVYNINNVPVEHEGAIDSCLWILRDWADGLTLSEEEIDKERGVIHEEWRTRQNAQMRIYDQLLPVLYPTERYARRMPIGTMEVVDNFPYQALRDYYEKWYRPDLQGLVVVGDIDVDEMEAKIKSIFSPIEMPAQVAERLYYPVDDNRDLIFALATDKEQQRVQILWMFKHPAIEREYRRYQAVYAQQMVLGMALQLLNQRLHELTELPVPPFSGASAGYGPFMLSATKDALSFSVVAEEEKIDTAFAALLREVERACRYGFTATELDRLRESYRSAIETDYAERDKRKNSEYTQTCIRHFLDNEPMMSDDVSYQINMALIDYITPEMVSGVLPSLMCDSNQVLIMVAPEKEGLALPGKEELLATMQRVHNEQLAPYEDKVSDDPLVSDVPASGRVVKEKQGKFGSTVWTLSNGAVVVVKPTDFKADEVSLSGYSVGGAARYAANEAPLTIKMLQSGELVSMGGVGQFSQKELRKKLAGKVAQAGVSVGAESESAGGSSTPKDLETMLQLLYLNFTAPRYDEESFASYKTHLSASLKSREVNPMLALSDTVNKELYQGHPLAERIKSDDVENIDYRRVFDLHSERFANASDFTFFIVGNVEPDSIKPLVEQYIASLPGTGRKDKEVKSDLQIVKGQRANNFKNKMETPKATQYVVLSGKVKKAKWNLMSFVQQILQIVYTEEVREKEGGTYGVSVSGSVDKEQRARMIIAFDTDPARRADMTKIVLDQLRRFADEGPSQENLDKVREYMLKSHAQQQKENGYWMSILRGCYVDGEDYHTGFEEWVNSITTKDLQKFLKKLLDQNNRVEVSMSPLD